MKPLFLVVISVFLSAVGTEAADPVRLRVLSYNIHHAEGVDRKLDLERIAEVIRSVKPDLVALQEVDQNVDRTEGIDQPAELARLTDLNVVFGANIELQGGHYGNAVLSRLPIVDYENHKLPNVDAGEQRGIIEAEIRLSDGLGSLRFFATHLDYRADERERLASAEKINDLASQAEGPAILAGDLNATPDSETLAIFKQAWTSANSDPLATVPVDRPRRQIDYVLFQPQERWRVVNVEVLPEAIASDHRAIFAVLELLPEKRLH
ncbi:endonuclease/exonuclease/phosphatase family protein [Rubinisphaera margarita]|uniref:endonuclease/exonuclease/phosphatase family protein n=1 Tax=Rubinisphaera margarita TaxID=2909586 RepID=UPI001EE90613|nr:endonuclease/exonuclease/phosphatase family protein [Rubinisphaera margarita]MCG6158237.1 endonuclease/exonuclease/phosphatase family protein [Rubinisphaera margarita]